LDQEPEGKCEEWCAWLELIKVSEAEQMLSKMTAQDGAISAIITVSTIHKVKGLEFDSVVIMPSSVKFPFNNLKNQATDSEKADNNLESSRADEARLYYVALTRARNRVWLGWGEREIAWSSGTDFSGNAERNGMLPLLTGSTSEVWLSYAAWYKLTNNAQEFIREKIKVGDEITLGDIAPNGGYPLKWKWKGKDKTIGRTENDKNAEVTTSLRISQAGEDRRGIMRLEVAAIYRHFFDANNAKDREMWGESANGGDWCYAVLIREIVGH
jgi:ATP-dependent exoDNAse (exonuclease V) beta subunit